MIFKCIIISVILILLVSIRIIYINILFENWNFRLKTHIENKKEIKHLGKIDHLRMIQYFKSIYLNPYKYYHRLNLWSIKSIINDPILIDEAIKATEVKRRKSMENYKNTFII